MTKNRLIIYLSGVLLILAGVLTPSLAQGDPRLPSHLRTPKMGVQNRGVGRPEGSRFLRHNQGRGLQSIRAPKGRSQMRSIKRSGGGSGGALGPSRVGGGAAGLKSVRSSSAQGGSAQGMRSIRTPKSGNLSLQDKRSLKVADASDLKRSTRRQDQSQSFLSRISNSIRGIFNNNKPKP